MTTVYATYDFAKQLTGEFDGTTDCCMLLTPGGESHSYEPSPADVAKIQSCDLFVYVGGASEQWAEKLIETSRKDKPNLRMFDYVELLDEEHKEGMEAEEEPDLSHGDDTETDEHIWTAIICRRSLRMWNMTTVSASTLPARFFTGSVNSAASKQQRMRRMHHERIEHA